jgi:hypothetical protein
MPNRMREMLLTALSAARYGVPPEPSITQAVIAGDRELTLDRLKFDSLAWMEFCISVELQSGQELTPADTDEMRYCSRSTSGYARDSDYVSEFDLSLGIFGPCF